MSTLRIVNTKILQIISEIVYRYYLGYAVPRLRESGFDVDILSYKTDYYSRGENDANICDTISDDYYGSSVNLSITYSGKLEKSLLDGMRTKYNLNDIEANPIIEISDNIEKENSDAYSKAVESETYDDGDGRSDVLATTTPDLDYDIEDAKEIYRRRLVERSNSVLKSVLYLVMNCISSGKESIDIDTGIVKEELSKLGADISDKGLYEIMCWLSTVLSETYEYKLDIVDSFQKDKIYIINISGWA